VKGIGVSIGIQLRRDHRRMADLGATLKAAREQAGLSLASMAVRTGYSKPYLSNVECGRRRVTPSIIRAYERVLGGNVDRRELFKAAAATAITAALPDIAVDVVRDIQAERAQLLSSVQTTHATDRVIGQLIARTGPV
jgi:transcriptional regulator with XRE-family HTH domain